MLPYTDEIDEIVETYISRKLMPSGKLGDAAHLESVLFFECDFLLTWNCTHIANANKVAHIRRVNAMPGLSVPDIVTPYELLGRDAYDEE